MKRFFIVSCLTFICLNIISQTPTVDVDKQNIKTSGGLNYFTEAGTPFVNAKFARLMSGSPFFKDEMMRGAIISTEGTEYRNIIIRLNLLESQVNYLDKNRDELIVGTPIREVILWDTINKKNYRFIFYEHIETTDKIEKDYYELLQTGKAQLFKQHKKIMKEDRPYNSATYEQSIQTNIRYFVLIAGQWKKIARVKDLPGVLFDKKTEVQQYISSKTLSGDNQEDLESVVSYYNSLFTK